MALKKPWVGPCYHSTHSTYSRGVRILVHKALPFTLLDLHLNPDGRYVVVHAMCDGVEMVIVGLYNPPSASLTVLHKLTPILAQYLTASVLAGDFNMPPNRSSAMTLHLTHLCPAGRRSIDLVMCGGGGIPQIGSSHVTRPPMPCSLG